MFVLMLVEWFSELGFSQSGYMLVILLSLTVALGGLFSTFVNQRAWTATRWIVFGLGPVSIAGGIISRARCLFFM